MSGYLRGLVLRSMSRGSLVEPLLTGPPPFDTMRPGPLSAIDEPIIAPAGDGPDRPTHTGQAPAVAPLSSITTPGAGALSHRRQIADSRRQPGSSASATRVPGLDPAAGA